MISLKAGEPCNPVEKQFLLKSYLLKIEALGRHKNSWQNEGATE